MPRIGSSRAASIHLVQYLFFFHCQSHLSGSASLFVHWKIITRSHVHPKNIQTLPTFEAVNIKIAAKPGETLNYNQAEVALNRQLCFNSKAKQSKTAAVLGKRSHCLTLRPPLKKVYIRFISESWSLTQWRGWRTNTPSSWYYNLSATGCCFLNWGRRENPNFPHLCVEKNQLSSFW